jgi:hypothetical protein
MKWQPKKGAAKVAKGNAHIDLLPGVRDGVAALSPLLRPIIERAWASDIIERNELDSEEPLVHQHLFGSERRPTNRNLRNFLHGRQGGVCFDSALVIPSPNVSRLFSPRFAKH